jgi:hypothetical protein
MAFVTALLAILVFVLTQSFLKLVLEPIQEQKKLIARWLTPCCSTLT